MSYFGISKYVSPPKSPVEGRKSPTRSPIIPFCTSPSQLNEVSTCPDFTFSNSLRSPDGPMRGRSVKEFEEQLGALKKENFNLKLRIYFLEERMGANFNLDKENIVKNNVELMVEIESLKKELQEKHELLCQAVKAMELEEDEFKKTAQSKNDEIITLKQEVEEMKLQLLDGKYENDNESSHKSYHSEPIFFSSQILSLPESSSRMKMLQERIASLENELTQEKENGASLQIILDQADVINNKYEQLQVESEKKDEIIKNVTEELDIAIDKISKLSLQMRDLEKFKEQSKIEAQKLSKNLAEKSKTVEEMEEHIVEVKRKYGNLKAEFDKEKQKFDKNKFISDMKITEMEEELEKQRGRVQDLQKKLGSAHQELKENQNLLVPKSPKRRSIVTNSDCDNVSVSNAAAPIGVSKEDALCNALVCKSPPKSPVSPRTFDFNSIYRILNTLMFSNKPQLMKQLDQLRDALSKYEQRIVHLKAQELKACAIIKSLMHHRKTSEQEAENHKERIAQLEKELEGVVSKPEGKELLNKDHEKPEEVGAEYEVLTNELENKIKILELTLKEKEIHLEYIESQNSELLNKLHNKEEDMINQQKNIHTKDQKLENTKEIADNTYSKLFDEKNKEIEKLNEELRKRTTHLQGVVNNELWEKNREIEKLQIKYAQLLDDKEKEMTEFRKSFSTLSLNLEELKAENEEKTVENSNLKIDISDLKLQLQLLRDKIGEIGLIPDDKLEVEIIISSLDDVKNIQKQLEQVKTERDILIKKIHELESSIQTTGDLAINAAQERELENLKRNLEMSEALRTQSNEACHMLREQLEELAIFLDSLMKQKSVLGLLGFTQNKKLREAIDHSLDLSKSLNVSLAMNSEQSLMQLSNITSLLNLSNLSNIASAEETNRYSFSIMPDHATLTYQNQIFNIAEKKTDQNQSFIMKSLEDQIGMLHRELMMKNSQLNKFRRESRSGKDLKSHSKPRISPTKLKNALTIRKHSLDSESETWSEPDVNVSKARIGLFKEDSNSVLGVEEIHSSDSTDESLTNLNYRRTEILNECQLTITKLNKQVQDLQMKLQEKQHDCIELQELREMSIISLKDENQFLKLQMEELKAKLAVIEKEKADIEDELKFLRISINDLEKSKEELMEKHDSKDKEMYHKINHMKFERDQLVSMAKEYANMTENSRQEIMILEKKITQLTIDKENLEKKLKKDYEKNFMEKIKNAEKDFTDRIHKIESNGHKEVAELNQKILELMEDYSKNYVKKSEVDMKINEVETLQIELDTLKESFSICKKAMEMSGNDEKKIKEELNNLHAKLNQTTIQYSEVLLEKSEIEQDLNEMNNRKVKLEAELDYVKQELILLKNHYHKEINELQSYKSKLELKVSELEFSNADLHNKLAKVHIDSSHHISNSPPVDISDIVDFPNRSIPINQVSPYIRQTSNSTQSCVSEDEIRNRGVFSIVIPQKSIDSERIEANSSPDLGIESDQGRFSSLEVQTQVSRPLLQTIEITESMNNLLDGDKSVQECVCEHKSCYQKSIELTLENNTLKKKLMKTKKALEDTVTQLTLANQRKKQVEKNICRQIHKTSQVLREAKANLDSGSEADFLKK